MHHVDPLPATSSQPGQPWWRELNRYHWFVFIVAALGWLFDTMDQQLFNLARRSAVDQLLQTDPLDPRTKAKPDDVSLYASIATAIFLMGWATGGVAFGIMGDRVGRAKTMLLTILIYSICTGLSALSFGFWDFTLWRFLTGLGVGGEFAVGIALLAEVMPDRARPFAIGWLQSLSAVGNITAAVLSMVIGDWRTLFLVGTGPALLAILIRRRLKEPERWQSVAVSDGVQKQLGSYTELFSDPRWRRNAFAGLGLAFAGVVGLWGIGFFSFDLIREVFSRSLAEQGVAKEAIEDQVRRWVGITSILQNLGGFVGIQAFMWLTHWTNRRLAFLVSFLAAMVATALTFAYVGKVTGFYDVFWMIPVMGCCQLALFGGYAIYFPELFPTRLRSTGTSFCYNVGRFVAAIGPLTLGLLTKHVFTSPPEDPTQGFRHAGVAMCAFFLIGLVALPFAPETKGQPLPE